MNVFVFAIRRLATFDVWLCSIELTKTHVDWHGDRLYFVSRVDLVDPPIIKVNSAVFEVGFAVLSNVSRV